MHARDWIMYAHCPTCDARTAERCRDLRYTMSEVARAYPHDDRPTRQRSDVRAELDRKAAR
jgi:hypothetical protein